MAQRIFFLHNTGKASQSLHPSLLTDHLLLHCCRSLHLLQVRVIRGGSEVTVSCFDLVVGDVLLVESGDILPADGLLVQGGAIK